MKRRLFLLAALALGGCAAMQPATQEAIAKLPVVRVGDTPPKSGDYVLHYPAGYNFPVTLKASGSLFTGERQVETHIALARDLYLYKYWASYDGRHWMNSHRLLKVEFGGGFDIHGLQSNISLDTQ